MGRVFDFYDARAYDEWLNRTCNRFALDMEKRLMLDMLQPQGGERVLDIGCGTGAGFQPLIDLGVQVSGLDASPYMLDIAKEKIKNRTDLHRGIAEDLPFDDNAFNYALLNTTLEFVDDPKKAIAEACRVAKDKLFIGVLNRYAVRGMQIRLQGLFNKTLFNHAQFYSVWELKQIIRKLVGDVPIVWRTVCQLPGNPGQIGRKIEQSGLVQRCPLGAYVGMLITLTPRFRTKTLPLRYRAKRTSSAAIS